MYHYFKSRILKRSIILAVIIGMTLSVIQFLSSLKFVLNYENIFVDSPYTRWLSIDPFGATPMLLFLVLPLMASIPTAMIFKDDFDIGLLMKVKFQRMRSIFSTIRGESPIHHGARRNRNWSRLK